MKIRKSVSLMLSVLFSFIGAFLLQFNQLTNLCYYCIFPVAIVLLLLSTSKLILVEDDNKTKIGIELGLFFLYSFLFCILQGTTMGILYWLPYFYCALILIFARNKLCYDLPQTIYKIFAVLGIVQSIGIILQVYLHNIWQLIVNIYMSSSQVNALVAREHDNYYSGFCTEVAVSAFYIVICVCICFFDIWYTKKLISFSTVAVVLGLYAIILTSKRAQLLFLVDVIIFSLIASNPDKNFVRRWGKYIIVSLIAIVIFLYFSQFAASDSSIGRLLSSFEGLSNGTETLDEFSTGRISFWILAIELFKKSPLVGIGWCNFYKHNSFGYHAHNTYLQVLCETGLLGMLMYNLFLLITIVYSIKEIKKCVEDGYIDQLKILCSAFSIQCFYLLYSITGNTLYDYWYFWAYTISTLFIFVIHEQRKMTYNKFRKNKIS